MEHDLTRGYVLKDHRGLCPALYALVLLQMLYGMADLYTMGQFSGAAGHHRRATARRRLYHYRDARGPGHGTIWSSSATPWFAPLDRAEVAIGNTITLFSGCLGGAGRPARCACKLWRSLARPPRQAKALPPGLRICFVGIPFIAAYNILGHLRGLGDSRSPM